MVGTTNRRTERQTNERMKAPKHASRQLPYSHHQASSLFKACFSFCGRSLAHLLSSSAALPESSTRLPAVAVAAAAPAPAAAAAATAMPTPITSSGHEIQLVDDDDDNDDDDESAVMTSGPTLERPLCISGCSQATHCAAQAQHSIA